MSTVTLKFAFGNTSSCIASSISFVSFPSVVVVVSPLKSTLPFAISFWISSSVKLLGKFFASSFTSSGINKWTSNSLAIIAISVSLPGAFLCPIG